MNLYLRLILVLIKSWFAKPVAIDGESRLSFRVLPFDCDINIHLTNSRYLAFMDLARTHLLGRNGAIRKILRKRWLPVVGHCEIRFLKALDPFQRFEIVTQKVGQDEKFFIIEQRFVRGNTVHAIAHVKVLFLERSGKKVPPENAMSLFQS